jgi:hypothetical protein
MVLIERDPARKSRVFFVIRSLNLSSVIPAQGRCDGMWMIGFIKLGKTSSVIPD